MLVSIVRHREIVAPKLGRSFIPKGILKRNDRSEGHRKIYSVLLAHANICV